MKRTILILSILFSIFKIHAQPLSVDTTFQPYFEFNFVLGGKVNGVYFDENDKIIVYGNFENSLNSSPYGNIIKMDSYGNKDNSWNYFSYGGGIGINYLTKIQNGYLFEGYDDIYGKLNQIGELDTSFNNTFNMRDKYCKSLGRTPYIFNDQSMFVGGKKCKCKYESANIYRAFMRILPNGKTDTLFNHNAWSNISGIFKYSSNKLLLAGDSLLFYDNIPVSRICRIDTSGNLDTTFKTNFTWGSTWPVHIQADGKILVGGSFMIENNARIFNLTRLNIDGSIDSTFNNFNSVNDLLNPYLPSVTTVCPTTDGGYLIGGTFKFYQGYHRNKIAKTNGDGFIDTTYFNGEAIADSTYHYASYPYSAVHNIQQTPDGKYYVMGHFTYYNGKKVSPIFRLNSLSNGINEKEKGKINVYPNPATNSINFNTVMYKDFNVTIFNAIGQTVLQQHCIASQNTFEIGHFRQGMYYYRLVTDKGEVLSGKFVKEK